MIKETKYLGRQQEVQETEGEQAGIHCQPCLRLDDNAKGHNFNTRFTI